MLVERLQKAAARPGSQPEARTSEGFISLKMASPYRTRQRTLPLGIDNSLQPAVPGAYTSGRDRSHRRLPAPLDFALSRKPFSHCLAYPLGAGGPRRLVTRLITGAPASPSA